MTDSTCKIDGCERPQMYREQGVCQMHYFRFMRNGHYGLKGTKDIHEPRPHKYRYVERKRGYSAIHSPGHPLADDSGIVREHRYVYYEQINKAPAHCEKCGADIDWSSLHIDHKDENPRNNSPENLRALCRPCNVFRGHGPLSMGKHFFEVDGRRMTAHAWARQPGVKVSGHTILRRRKMGWSDFDAIYGERLTHQSTKTKKMVARYDRVRGIA